MIKVTINDDSQGAFEKALKRFKKLCQDDGFMRELRERKFFKKRSVKKRQKRLEAIRISKRNQRKEQ